MEIQRYNPTKETAIQKALNSKTVRDSTESELYRIITSCITKSFADSGQLPDESNLNYMVRETVNEVKSLFKNVRVDEIPIAFHRGVRKEYGEYFGLNVLTFSGFLKSYMESDARKKEVIDMNRASLPDKKAPSKEELLQMENDIIVNAFKKFRDSGHFDDLGNHVYNKLDQRGLIPFSAERKKQMFEQAKENLIRKNCIASAVSLEEKRSIQRNLDAIIGNKMGSGGIVVCEAKKVALNALFSELQEMGSNIENLIENHV